MSKVLVVGPSWLGDMIMTQSLFKILHSQGKMIDVLAPKWNHSILHCMPEINKAIESPFNHGDLDLFNRYKFSKVIKKQNYDEAIIIPNSFKSALIPYWAGIKKRTGWLGEYRYGVLNNAKKLNKKLFPLMVQRLAALAFFNREISIEDLASIDYSYPKLIVSNDVILSALTNHDLHTNNKIIILAPGAAYGETKKWPAEYFAKIAEDKLKSGWQVWMLGSPKDRQAAELVNMKTGNQCVDLTGKLKLEETVALISCANIIVSNDSGLLHVAAAVDTPLVGIYGSTSPNFTPPLITDHKKRILQPTDVACSPCFKKTCIYGNIKCLYDIKPEEVNQAINNLITT